MLFYKIKDENININHSQDYSYMMNLISMDYSNYFKASEQLQGRYDVCLHAIYSCLNKVNNLNNKSGAHRELSKFLNKLKKKTGINMQIVSKDKLYVKQKAKRK